MKFICLFAIVSSVVSYAHAQVDRIHPLVVCAALLTDANYARLGQRRAALEAKPLPAGVPDETSRFPERYDYDDILAELVEDFGEDDDVVINQITRQIVGTENIRTYVASVRARLATLMRAAPPAKDTRPAWRAWGETLMRLVRGRRAVTDEVERWLDEIGALQSSSEPLHVVGPTLAWSTTPQMGDLLIDTPHVNAHPQEVNNYERLLAARLNEALGYGEDSPEDWRYVVVSSRVYIDPANAEPHLVLTTRIIRPVTHDEGPPRRDRRRADEAKAPAPAFGSWLPAPTG